MFPLFPSRARTVLTCCPEPNTARVRTWTDRSGAFKVEAEFIGLKEGKIHLHKLNGVKIAVPVTKMAIEDLEYVEAATGVSLEDDKPLSDIKRRSTLRAKERSQRREPEPQAGAKIDKTPDYDWFDFFLAAGVNPQICERYAAAFSRDQMGEEVLPDVDAQLLRTLGLKEGDILRVMKYLDNKFARNKAPADGTNGDAATGEGGLFSGPGGALRNNTRKGRPAPAVQTNDVVDPDAFKPKDAQASKALPADAAATPLASAPARQASSGFDDDAWDVKPSKTPAADAPAPAPPAPAPAPTTAPAPAPAAPAAAPTPAPEAPKPQLTGGMSDLSLLSPALQPAAAPQPAPQPPAPAAPQGPRGADPSFFDKLAAPSPLQAQVTGLTHQRPPVPPQMQTGGAMIAPPPARAASAPGFQQQQPSGFAPPPLQPQMTGYQAPPGQSLQDIRQQQQFIQQQQQQMMPQMTGFPQQGMMPQATGFQPQPGFMNTQPTGFQQQPSYQQALNNGQMNGSPFADPNPRYQTIGPAPVQPQPTGFGMQPQPTGYPMQPQQTGLPQPLQPQRTGFVPQSAFGQHVTGMNGYGPQQPQNTAIPPMPPMPTGFGQQNLQQFGGVSQLQPQPTGLAPLQPLVPQKTGPPPPVRFGVQPANRLTAQPTGRRANLANASAQNPFGF